MAAFLRQQLVLDLHRAGARVLEGAHHVHDIERLAVAGVAVHQHRQAAGARDLTDKEVTSSTVMMPRSGNPIEADIAAPER